MRPTHSRIFREGLEKYRLTGDTPYASQKGDPYGAFFIPREDEPSLRVIIDNGQERDGTQTFPWDHVSVSTQERCPTWEEMCMVKDLVFLPEEVVVQFHPAEEHYVNHHPFCLHMWRYHGEIPVPDSIQVGPKS